MAFQFPLLFFVIIQMGIDLTVAIKKLDGFNRKVFTNRLFVEKSKCFHNQILSRVSSKTEDLSEDSNSENNYDFRSRRRDRLSTLNRSKAVKEDTSIIHKKDNYKGLYSIRLAK